MKTKSTAVFALLLALMPVHQLYAQVVERDALHKFTVSRPPAWFPQERPTDAVRVMLGIEGDGYVGNCNISVLPSRSTAALTQSVVDETENKRVLPVSFFQRQLQAVAPDVKVSNVKVIQRGLHFGQLVNYTYSYISPSIKARVYLRAELFSHSRPGSVYSFTCNTGALSPEDAERAFSIQRAAFERFSSSLRVGA